jgi:DNA repair ATPase RecN
MTYTVIQLEKMLKISRGTIYKRLETDELKPFVAFVNKTKVLKAEGLSTLQTLIESLKKQSEIVPEQDKMQLDKFTGHLEKQVEELKQECQDWKRRYIDKCEEWDMKSANFNNQLLQLKAETNKEIYLLTESIKPRSFFNIFKRKAISD